MPDAVAGASAHAGPDGWPGAKDASVGIEAVDRAAKAASHWVVEWESGLYTGGAAVGSCTTAARAGPPAPLQLNGLADATVKVERVD